MYKHVDKQFLLSDLLMYTMNYIITMVMAIAT